MKDQKDKQTGDLLASPDAVRQARYAERMKAKGMRQRKFWLTDDEYEALRECLYVALNPLIAQAVMGGGQHVRISMDEVRALDSETARLLHQRLCGWIDPGKTGKASIDTLCGYVWPSEASGSTMRKRRQRVREALPELVALGWTVTEFAAGKYDITRPKAAG